MQEALLEKRVDRLEEEMMKLVYQSRKTEMAIERLAEENRQLSREMKEFKDEMKEFKDEMSYFKREMLEESKRKNKEWSNVAKKMGTIVEDLIAPALRPVLKQYFNCEVRMEGQRMLKRIGGDNYEIDAIALCDDMVFMVEVRSTPRYNDINEIKDKSQRFFEFFPEFSGKRLIMIFGSITFSEQVIKNATKNGIYVMGWREWEYMDILNFREVKQ